MNRLRSYLDVGSDERILLWTPTYRKQTTLAAVREDGADLRSILFSDESAHALNAFLSASGSRLIVKTHPQEDDWNLGNANAFDHIHVMSDSEFAATGLEVYDILAAVDVLITDYSSIFSDYLLLNRPMVFFVPDFDIYHERRGFLLEPFDFWTPGPKVRTIEELRLELEQILQGNDFYKEHREKLLPVFHTYIDDRACERVMKWLLEDTAR